jgi:lipoprotein NlpI
VGPIAVVVAIALSLVAEAGQREDDNLARCASEGDAERIIHYCTRAIATRPLEPSSLAAMYHNRAGAYVEKGEYDRAVRDYDEAIRLMPRVSYWYGGRGLAFLRKGDSDSALRDFDTAIRMNAADVTALLNRAVLRAARAEYTLAINDYDTALRLRPDANAFYGRADAYHRQQICDPALADYNRALALQPSFIQALLGRAIARFCLRDFMRSSGDLRRVVQLSPKDLYAILWLHVAEIRSGDDGRNDLEGRVRHVNLAEWPGIIVDYFLGRRTADEVLEEADRPPIADSRRRRCQALFFTAQKELSVKRREQAFASLQRLVSTCPNTLYEYGAAQMDLKALP